MDATSQAMGAAFQAMGALDSALAGAAGTMMPSLAGSLLGILNQAGIEAQQGVWNGPSPRPDAGTALAGAGNLFGQSVGKLFDLPGMHNHITGTMKTDHVGCARVEQVGTSKVTHVGSTFATRVGKAWTMIVGQNASTTTGADWSLTAGGDIMKHAGQSISVIADASIYAAAKDDVTISGKTILLSATDSITLQVGETASIVLDRNGLILLQASNTVSSQATTISSEASQVVGLKGGSATFTVGPAKVLSDPEVEVGSNWGAVETVLKVVVDAVPILRKIRFLKDGAGYIGKLIDKSWLGKKINKGIDAFGDYMQHGYKMKDGTTVYPDGTTVGPNGDVYAPPLQNY